MLIGKNKIPFTVSDINIVAMYKDETKARTIENITDFLCKMPDKSASDIFTKENLEYTIMRLDLITEAEFAETVFVPEYGD